MNNRHLKYLKLINRQGATLLELLVSIFLIIIMISVFGSVLWSVNLNREIKYKSAAHFLALGEMETIRKMPFMKLTNRTNSNFIGVAYNLGKGQIKAESTAPSLPNIYWISPAPAASNNITSLAFVESDSLDNFDLETAIKVPNISPSGWQTGLVFHYQDLNNYYRFIFNSSSIKMEKIINGSVSSLYSANRSFNLNTWYKLKITAADGTINLYLDDLPLAAINNNDLDRGVIGLVGLNSAQIYADDTTLTLATPTSWNYDSEPVGSVSSGWERFGINDLPQGQDKLTIEDYNGSANIKRITVKVNWQEKQKNQSVELTSLIGQYGLNP